MSNVIAFLESLGRNPDIRPASAELAAAVAALPVGDDARAARLAGDAGTLGDLMGGRPKMICMLFPADDDQKQDEDSPAKDEPDGDEPKESIRH